MAESLQVFAAEPMALFEDADQLIADEYFNNRQTTRKMVPIKGRASASFSSKLKL